eukprot:jgi/Mesen1/685/ME000109S_10903
MGACWDAFAIVMAILIPPIALTRRMNIITTTTITILMITIMPSQHRHTQDVACYSSKEIC